MITERAVERSQFKAILNEKDPPPGALTVEITDIAPAFLTPESGLTVRGTLHNRTDDALTGVDAGVHDLLLARA